MRPVIAFLWLLHWLPLPVLGRFGAAIDSGSTVIGGMIARIPSIRADIASMP